MADDALLDDIRKDFVYFRDYWREQHEEMKTDLRFVSGDPWDSQERQAREDNHRPVLCPDELGQYLNSAINNLRQNQRAIKVNPAGEGATDQIAEQRGAIISGIEYRSDAQQAYTNAFECALNCGLGFWRVSTKRLKGSKNVEPCIRIIDNPLSVLPDPDAKEPDFSDQKRCFIIDTIRQRDFERKYPKAQKRGFSAEEIALAPEWFFGENMTVAEYWRIDGYDEDGNGGKVTQYITNGLEILEENPWAGSWIPAIVLPGKQVFVPKGGNIKRQYFSMIRKARGPQMMLAYIASQEAEEYGMAPRAPFVGYVGQFTTDKDAWDALNKIPRSYVQVDPVVDVNGGQPLPLPTRTPFQPNAQAYEIGFERWRRSIQSAMGITPLPTAAQRQNEKSGIALEKIQTQQDIGAFHFTDNFDRALEFCGKQIDELITKVIDTRRQVQARTPDDKSHLLHVAPEGSEPPAGAQPNQVFNPQAGEWDVTISTGPSYQSQRDRASQFIDLLVQEIDALPVPPQAKATILSLGVKMKDLGPEGDQIAKILDPQGGGEPVPPQAQQMIAQLQQQLQVTQIMAQKLMGENQQLQFEKKAQIVQNQGKIDLEKLRIEAQVTTAEIDTKSQQLSERIEFVHDMVKQLIAQRHEGAMTAASHAHEAALSAQESAQQQQMLSQQSQMAQQEEPEEEAVSQ